jgi:hypothetical protein
VSFAAISLCVASKRVFIFVSVYFVIDSVRKLLDIPSYLLNAECWVSISERAEEFRLKAILALNFPRPVCIASERFCSSNRVIRWYSSGRMKKANAVCTETLQELQQSTLLEPENQSDALD